LVRISKDPRLGAQLLSATSFLRQAGVGEYRTDARILLESCVGLSRTQLLLSADRVLQEQDLERFHARLLRRAEGEPAAYIIGEREFWSLSFQVSPAVLIPRPETEFLLDRALALTDPENLKAGAILDLCCGSGVIATVLAKETGRSVVGSDISADALQIAAQNYRRHVAAEAVHLVQADLLSGFGYHAFTLVVSNPPYVRSLDIANTLDREVRDHEPHLALNGGDSGLDFITVIHAEIPFVVCPGGQLFMEIGADQGQAVLEMFHREKAGVNYYRDVKILQDYAGRDRVLMARLRR
jgi:release factor glutamine methyltransferase